MSRRKVAIWIVGVLVVLGTIASIASIDEETIETAREELAREKQEAQEANEKQKTDENQASQKESKEASANSNTTVSEKTPPKDQPKEEAKQANNTSQKNVSKSVPGTIGLTTEQFKTAFNKAVSEFQIGTKINKLKIEKGDAQDVFEHQITEHSYLLGTINKDGSIRDVMVMGAGDGTPQSGLNVMGSIGLIIAATNPSLSASERGDVLKELGILGDDVDVYNLDSTIVKNGLRYHIQSSDVFGIMFTVSDPNDN